MTNINFEFLAGLEPVTIEKQVKEKVSRATPKNPTGMSLRIFKDGSCFPSRELAEKFDLEYMNVSTEEAVRVPMGFDIVNSTQWGQYPKEAQQVVLVAVVPKSEAKVDLFKSVDYNEDGTPKKSVLTQGSKRPEIIEMLREVYNRGVFSQGTSEEYDILFGSKNYVDLEVVVSTQVFPELNAYCIPKTQSRGEAKGKSTYVTRTKGTQVFPLVISMEVEEEVNQVEEVLEENEA